MGYYKEARSKSDKRMQGNEKLQIVQAWQKDLQPEEFPEGPYGSTVFLDQPIGKSSEWKPGQHVVTRFQDENPTTNDFKVPTDADLPDM